MYNHKEFFLAEVCMAWQTKNNFVDYWKNLTINQNDLNALTNHLFETESPAVIEVLATVFVNNRLKEIQAEEELKQEEAGFFYHPKEEYPVGTKIIFPELNWISGVVAATREGNNPIFGDFSVITVEFDDGSTKEFASNLEDHILNDKTYMSDTISEIDANSIMQEFGVQIKRQLSQALANQNELVLIGHSWFPKSLLIDIGIGSLNIAEAILDSMDGGPIGIAELMKQLEMTDEENKQLLEFSLNYALQEDSRFDEVGSSGVFSWYLKRMEPKSVLEVPLYLQSDCQSLEREGFDPDLEKLFSELSDELTWQIDPHEVYEPVKKVRIPLSYPHWRAGTLPITPETYTIFPSALQSERIKIDFQDEISKERIPAWVVRPHRYVTGLKEWYEDQNLIPGSIVEIASTKDPGVIKINIERKRSNKEWIKTVLVGADGGIVFALLRQSIYAGFNDRMAIAIPDVKGLDQIWENRSKKEIPLKNDVTRLMHELSKLNNQSHVHFVDLYAGINVIRRVSPQELFFTLANNDEFTHIGDNYYHLSASQ